MHLAARLLAIIAVALSGFVLANIVYDAFHLKANYISRKLTHLFGGVAYCLAVLWLEPWEAVTLSAGVTLGVIGLRVLWPESLRGTGGAGRPNAIAEINYPLAATICLAVGWWWLGQWFLALFPILCMAVGDSVTGLCRAYVYRREQKGLAGSIPMFIVCAMLAVIVTPLWAGLAGALAATIAEKLTPASRWVDDNLTLTLAALVVTAGLWALV